MRIILKTFLVLTLFCSPVMADVSSDRADIQKMKNETLARLYEEEPGTKDAVANAVGYAVFASGGVNVVLFSAAYGSGVAHDNEAGSDTYMEMASGGVGLGLGVKDYRVVFIFRTREAYDRFVDHGWDLSGQADAAAKAGTDGVELSEAADVMPGVTIYQLTENGLALQATIQGTKYWKDDDLN